MTNTLVAWLAALIVLGSGAIVPSPRAAAPAAPIGSQRQQAVAATQPAAVIKRYCVSCHNARLNTGGLMLEPAMLAEPATHAAALEKVVRKLRGRTMPPQGLPRPDDATYDGLAASIEQALDAAAAARPTPGRTAAVHRL